MSPEAPKPGNQMSQTDKEEIIKYMKTKHKVNLSDEASDEEIINAVKKYKDSITDPLPPALKSLLNKIDPAGAAAGAAEQGGGGKRKSKRKSKKAKRKSKKAKRKSKKAKRKSKKKSYRRRR